VSTPRMRARKIKRCCRRRRRRCAPRRPRVHGFLSASRRGTGGRETACGRRAQRSQRPGLEQRASPPFRRDVDSTRQAPQTGDVRPDPRFLKCARPLARAGVLERSTTRAELKRVLRRQLAPPAVEMARRPTPLPVEPTAASRNDRGGGCPGDSRLCDPCGPLLKEGRLGSQGQPALRKSFPTTFMLLPSSGPMPRRSDPRETPCGSPRRRRRNNSASGGIVGQG